MSKREYKQLSEHFNEREFACKHCGRVGVDMHLITKLEELRAALGNKPVRVTSGYRCPTHNRAVGGAKNSQHVLGKAADITVNGLRHEAVADTAEKLGFGGVGRYRHFTHVDVRDGKARWKED